MNKKGVTLIELLIVIIVMGIISAFSVPAVGMVLDNMNKDAILTSAETVENAAKLYCSQTILDDCKIDDTLEQAKLSPYITGIDVTYTFSATKTSTNQWSVIYTKADELSFPFNSSNEEVALQVPSLSDRALINLSTYGGGSGGDPIPEGPYIVLLGDATVYVEIATTYNDPGSIAYDSQGDVESNTWTSGTVNYWALGSYSKVYECYSTFDNDYCATATRTIIVQDTIPPDITINGDTTVYVRRRTWYSDQGAWAVDNSNQYVSVVTTGVNDVNVQRRGTYYVTYTSTDASGNEAIEIRTVIVY